MDTRIIIPTVHALKRANSRGITAEMILDTIKFGKLIQKQGLKFYIMLRKNMPVGFAPQYADRVNNTTVILSESDTIVTVYKNKRSHRTVCKKAKVKL